MTYLLDVATFKQVLRSKLLQSILEIKNSVSWQEVIHDLAKYSKIKRKVGENVQNGTSKRLV